MDSILTDSTDTPEQDAFLDKVHAVPSSVSSGFFHSVSTVSDASRPQVSPGINSYKLWCHTRALHLPVLQAGKISPSKVIHYFSSHPAAFRFQASLSPANISLNPANKKIDMNLSDFQTSIGAAAHANLDTELLISNTRTALIDTYASLQGSVGGVIATLDVHGLLSRFMTFWMILCLNRLVMQLIILLPGNNMKLGPTSSPLFIALKIPSILVRLAFMDASTGPWHRLTTNPVLNCPNPQPR